MESLSSKEFFDQLKTNALKPAMVLKGIVKKSDKDSEVLFTKKGDFTNWVKIPSSMIKSVFVIKTFSKAEERFTVVKLHLNTPETPEGTVLFELLSLKGKEEMGDENWNKEGSGHCCHSEFGYSGMKGKSCDMGAGHFCPHCGCYHSHYGGHGGGSQF